MNWFYIKLKKNSFYSFSRAGNNVIHNNYFYSINEDRILLHNNQHFFPYRSNENTGTGVYRIAG